MKYILIATFVIFCVKFCNNVTILNPIERVEKELSQTEKLFLQCVKDLKKSDRIDKNIPDEIFAKWLHDVAYCESGLKPHIERNNGAGGIFQWQKATREYCGLPADISNSTLEEQILVWVPKYFAKCGRKVTKQIQSIEDLHWVFFLPFDSDKKFTGQNELDLDSNGIVDYADLKKFHEIRLKELYN